MPFSLEGPRGRSECVIASHLLRPLPSVRRLHDLSGAPPRPRQRRAQFGRQMVKIAMNGI